MNKYEGQVKRILEDSTVKAQPYNCTFSCQSTPLLAPVSLKQCLSHKCSIYIHYYYSKQICSSLLVFMSFKLLSHVCTFSHHQFHKSGNCLKLFSPLPQYPKECYAKRFSPHETFNILGKLKIGEDINSPVIVISVHSGSEQCIFQVRAWG